MTRNVLITGARSAAALDLARDWARAGYRPHLADCSLSLIARTSRAPAGVHRYASPRADRPRFAADVLELVSRLDPILVIPTCEEIYHLSAPPLGLELGGRLLAPDLDVLRTLHAKDLFVGLCRRLGLDAPETATLTDRSNLTRFTADPSAWVFKPVYSRFGARALIAPCKADLRRLAPTMEQPWVAQRRVAGEEVCFYAAAREGSLTAFAAYRSPWRLAGGAGYAFEAVGDDLGERLRAQAGALADELRLDGQIACDAIVGADGRPQLIECNPRATSGLHLLTGEGELARAMLGQAVSGRPCSGSRHLAPALWTYGLGAAARRGRWAEWAREARTGRDAIGAPGDRWPVPGALLDSGWFAVRALRRRSTLAEAMTADIEWNGEDLS